ncbi:hypothetical protein EV421DRAFT_1803575 [Armillaria borealis]|uniref:Uncharacterized protein n=1 Tax=Armillaria borealis TaxID=47425 RepID=A0AA39JKX5_9AGAR|nr:hypothetical protein EV421DRAFT_1803575 [Armillaria borealis]
MDRQRVSTPEHSHFPPQSQIRKLQSTPEESPSVHSHVQRRRLVSIPPLDLVSACTRRVRPQPERSINAFISIVSRRFLAVVKGHPGERIEMEGGDPPSIGIMHKGATGYAQRTSTEIRAIQGLPGGTPIDDGPYVMLLDSTTNQAAHPQFVPSVTALLW